MCAIHILSNRLQVVHRATVVRPPTLVAALLAAVGVLLVIVVGLGQSAAFAQGRQDDDAPGSTTVRLARPTWDTGWFQAEIAALLLGELGYTVDGPVTMENEAFYDGVANGEIDLWVNGWFPLHDGFLDGNPAIEPVGYEVRGGALQGYLADRRTVEELEINTLADLADPEVAMAFDTTGDGRADLVGCNLDWACGPIVDHHLMAYGLTDTVDQLQGDYGPLMRSTIDRYRSGQPVLFYTFTPNWTVGELTPGVDVVWIPAPFPSLPDDIGDQEPLTVVPQVAGCLQDPCSMGFAPNDIRSVAGTEFLDRNPAIRSLLGDLQIPLDDISDQNASMIRGEDDEAAIEAHAREWLITNRLEADRWIDRATAAHEAAGLSPLPAAPSATSAGQGAVGSLRVVTRVTPPFVSYDQGRYQGFSIDLLDMVAADIGADIDLYTVNTSAKLIDDVNRSEADLGIGALAITARREEAVDFSQPYFDSGLQILVAERDGGFLGGRLGAVAKAIFSPDLLVLFGVLLTVLFVAAHIIWLTERGKNPDFPRTYRAGIWESFWWAAVTATTVGYGDKTPKGVTGRIFGLFWMFSGLFVLAYFTAGIATAFTIDELNRTIDDPAELRNHTVGAPVDSNAVDYLDRQGIAVTRYERAEDAYTALLNGDIEAVVHDAAILQHFVATNEAGGATVSGLIFAELGFGFAMPPGSELTEPVNRSLLGLIESGRFEELHDKWFGAAKGRN